MKIGIILGRSFEVGNVLESYKELEIETPFGKPSSKLFSGKLGSVDVVILLRHGLKQEITPSQVNNKANIFALKYEGCKYILSTTVVGSLREEIQVGDFVAVDDFIDFTTKRQTTFYDKFEFGPIQSPMINPFSEILRKKLIESCEEFKFKVYKKAIIIGIEGPRFSTRAESKMFRQFGADVINMSTIPEAILANEGEIPYIPIAICADYDSWKVDELPLNWQTIKWTMKEHSEKVKRVLLRIIESFSKEQEIIKLKQKIRTIKDFPTSGIMFRDITTILKDKESLKKLVSILYEKYKDTPLDLIAAVESRGFAIAGILAEKLNTGLVLIRKPGKLPAETISETYNLEYGTDSLEIHRDSISPGQKVLILDDLIATGGTAVASCQLVEKLGGQVEGFATIIELEDLKGRDSLKEKGYKLFSIMKFKENEE